MVVPESIPVKTPLDPKCSWKNEGFMGALDIQPYRFSQCLDRYVLGPVQSYFLMR